MSISLVQELARMKALFQGRAIHAVITGTVASSCKVCGQTICDHSDVEYGGIVSPLQTEREGK